MASRFQLPNLLQTIDFGKFTEVEFVAHHTIEFEDHRLAVVCGLRQINEMEENMCYD